MLGMKSTEHVNMDGCLLTGVRNGGPEGSIVAHTWNPAAPAPSLPRRTWSGLFAFDRGKTALLGKT